MRQGDETGRRRYEQRPGDQNRATAQAIDEKAGRHRGEQPAQCMHDDHKVSDAEAGVEGFGKYRYRRCCDTVAQRKDERRKIQS